MIPPCFNLPAHKEQVCVSCKSRNTVCDEDIVKIMLLDVIRNAHAVISQVNDMDFRKIFQQERNKAVGIGVAYNEQRRAVVASDNLM